MAEWQLAWIIPLLYFGIVVVVVGTHEEQFDADRYSFSFLFLQAVETSPVNKWLEEGSSSVFFPLCTFKSYLMTSQEWWGIMDEWRKGSGALKEIEKREGERESFIFGVVERTVWKYFFPFFSVRRETDKNRPGMLIEFPIMKNDSSLGLYNTRNWANALDRYARPSISPAAEKRIKRFFFPKLFSVHIIDLTVTSRLESRCHSDLTIVSQIRSRKEESQRGSCVSHFFFHHIIDDFPFSLSAEVLKKKKHDDNGFSHKEPETQWWKMSTARK